MNNTNRITIICGHYGSGKTNLALNLAIESAQIEPTVLVDMDIVNPYFRSSEYKEVLSNSKVRLVSPTFAGTTLDTPTLPPEINTIFEKNGENVIIDAGGDDAGIIALAGISEKIKVNGYKMIYVINKNRVLSQTPDGAIQLLREIEAASHLKATGIVNNTHLGVETKERIVLDSISFAKETANLSGLPLLYSTIPDFAVENDISSEIKIIHRYVQFPWERDEN